jgi:hypothetical protein
MVRLGGLGASKNISDLLGSRPRDLPACSIALVTYEVFGAGDGRQYGLFETSVNYRTAPRTAQKTALLLTGVRTSNPKRRYLVADGCIL